MPTSDDISDEVRFFLNSISVASDPNPNHAELMLYRHCREGRGSVNALYFEGETYSYRQVADAAASCASWLQSLGIAAGDSVILSLPDCPVLAASYFGVVSVGATAIILNPALSNEDAFYIAQLCNARLTVTYDKLLGRLLPLTSLEGMIAVKAAGLSWRDSSEIVESVPVTQHSEYSVSESSNSYAYGLLSSGSTGRPKLIVHRHQDILFGYLAFARPVLQLTAADRVICVAKMTTGYGLGCSLLMSFLAGASSALVSEAPSAAVTTVVAMHGCTLLFAQPRFLAETLSHSEPPNKLRTLRLVITGGEPLGSALADRWRQFSSAELLDSYGSTEVGYLYISNRPGHTTSGSVGKPVPGMEIEVIDENSEPVKVGQTGKLRVRGPMVISGYWNDPVRTEQSFHDGWFTTSDMFSFDQDGHYYIHGRSDYLIKLGCGDWVNPNELEMVLLEHASVNECAIVGAPDDAGLTVLKAFVVAAGDRNQSLASELSNLIRDRWPLEDYKRIGVVEFTDALPKTAAGKLDRLKLSPQSMTEFSYKC
jgi:acyl-coenzyme A synthetase/AMP-(fatty) acid ligase